MMPSSGRPLAEMILDIMPSFSPIRTGSDREVSRSVVYVVIIANTWTKDINGQENVAEQQKEVKLATGRRRGFT